MMRGGFTGYKMLFDSWLASDLVNSQQSLSRVEVREVGEMLIHQFQGRTFSGRRVESLLEAAPKMINRSDGLINRRGFIRDPQ